MLELAATYNGYIYTIQIEIIPFDGVVPIKFSHDDTSLLGNASNRWESLSRYEQISPLFSNTNMKKEKSARLEI